MTTLDISGEHSFRHTGKSRKSAAGRKRNKTRVSHTRISSTRKLGIAVLEIKGITISTSLSARRCKERSRSHRLVQPDRAYVHYVSFRLQKTGRVSSNMGIQERCGVNGLTSSCSCGYTLLSQSVRKIVVDCNATVPTVTTGLHSPVTT